MGAYRSLRTLRATFNKTPEKGPFLKYFIKSVGKVKISLDIHFEICYNMLVKKSCS